MGVLSFRSNPVAERTTRCSHGSDFNKLFRNLRKIEILLREFEHMGKRVDYYALDLSLSELQRTFSEISTHSYEHVGYHGLHGTYDDALAWISNPVNRIRPTCIMSMGSSLGNFSRPGAAEFLSRYAKVLGPFDSIIIGLDGCKDPEKVYKAYNDSRGITRRFYENGLLHANAVLGSKTFDLDKWEVVTRYDPNEGRHQAFYSPNQDVTIQGVHFRKGDKLFFEEATKYDPEERDSLWHDAGLIHKSEFGNSSDDYRKRYLLAAILLGIAVDSRIFCTQISISCLLLPSNYPCGAHSMQLIRSPVWRSIILSGQRGTSLHVEWSHGKSFCQSR